MDQYEGEGTPKIQSYENAAKSKTQAIKKVDKNDNKSNIGALSDSRNLHSGMPLNLEVGSLNSCQNVLSNDIVI